jgi:hypothetical protein
MDRCVAEVVLRFTETTVTVAHIAAGGRIRAGRDAEVAVDVTPFTLVDSTQHGFVMRRGPDAEPEALVDPVTLQFGDVTIAIALVPFPRVPLARKKVEQVPLVFGAGSLAAHVGVILLAFALVGSKGDSSVPGMDTSRGRPARIARFAVEAQTVKREDKPAPTEAPITVDETPSERPLTDKPAPAAAQSIDSVQSPNGKGKELVPSTPESHASDGETGSERRFDPDANANFNTVKVGNYSTVATGQAAGAEYQLAGENGRRKPLIVVSCDSSTCLILGGDPKSGVREQLEQRLPEIVACYEQHADTAGKKLELDFGITDGKVDKVDVGGVGDYDSCVANIINSLTFEKPADS